jgi:hypothetical protein
MSSEIEIRESKLVLFAMTTLTDRNQPFDGFPADVSRRITLVMNLTCSHAAIHATIPITFQDQRSLSAPIV